MQAPSSDCGAGSCDSGTHRDSSINSGYSSYSDDEEPAIPVTLCAHMHDPSKKCKALKPHKALSLGRNSQAARQPGSESLDGYFARLEEEELDGYFARLEEEEDMTEKEMFELMSIDETTLKSKQKIEENAKKIENVFGEEMRQAYIAFEGYVLFFCTTIAEIMKHPLVRWGKTNVIMDVCMAVSSKACGHNLRHYAIHLHGAMEKSQHCLDRVNLDSIFMAFMASMRDHAAVLEPAQDVAQAQNTIQKCQLVLNLSKRMLSKLKQEIESAKENFQSILGLL